MTSSDTADLAGYEVIVAVSGGIAAYKVCSAVSKLVQRGAGVTVTMTESATRFVGVATFQALTAREVLTNLWSAADAYDPQHISLTHRADVMLIAPATANIIGKIACGICDDLVTTMVAAAPCPLILAPAMNDVMWAHPPVQANVARLREYGYTLLDPQPGWLACRSVGPGRMVEAESLVDVVASQLLSSPPRRPGGNKS